MNVLESLIKIMNFSPEVMMEVGVNTPSKCRLRNFENSNRILVEPLPDCAELLRNEIFPATVLELAIGNKIGKSAFVSNCQLSRISDTNVSPASYRRIGQETTIEVQVVPFCHIDPGNIDVLLIDTEGSEWEVFRTMISKPKIIVVETHSVKSKYRNSNLALIEMWFKTNGYGKIRGDSSDSWYVRDQSL